MFDTSTGWMIIGALLGASYPLTLYWGDRHLTEQRKRKRTHVIDDIDPKVIQAVEHIGLTECEWKRWLARDEAFRTQVRMVAQILIEQGARKVVVSREGMLEPLAILESSPGV